MSGREATHASDLYAAGCLLYCCLAGEPPFGGPTAIAIAMRHLRDQVPPLRPRRPDLPAGLDTVIMHALEKEPSRRFSTAQEMDVAVAATGLDRRPATDPQVAAVPAATTALHDHPVGASFGAEQIQHPVQRGSSTGWLAALTAFLVVAAAAAVAVLYLQSRQPPLVEATPLPTATPLVATSEPTTEASPSPTETPDDEGDDDDAEQTPGNPLGNLPGFGGD